jgi:hypothetical protein
MMDIDFDRVAEVTGITLMPWQRALVQQIMDHHPDGFPLIVHRPRRHGFASMAHVLEVLIREPWRLPDRPRWPRFELVPLPFHLEYALDRLLARLPWRT